MCIPVSGFSSKISVEEMKELKELNKSKSGISKDPIETKELNNCIPELKKDEHKKTVGEAKNPAIKSIDIFKDNQPNAFLCKAEITPNKKLDNDFFLCKAEIIPDKKEGKDFFLCKAEIKQDNKILEKDSSKSENKSIVEAAKNAAKAAIKAIKGNISKDDTTISKDKVSPQELKWAEDLQEKIVKGGYKPNPKEVQKYEEIYKKYQNSNENIKEKSKVSVSPEEKQWAIALEKQIAKGYTPNDKDIKRYQEISIKLSNANSMPNVYEKKSNVTQSEIDWATELEKKIKFEKYKPNQQERDVYTKIYNTLKEENKGGFIDSQPKDYTEKYLNQND
ncbi:MAG: hypothetical protein U0457_02825 [Candidatus Sericytochromatia bacterium]